MAMGEPYRPIPRRRIPAPPPAPRHRPAGCLPAALVGLLLLACLSAYLLFPAKTTLLLIGIDYIDDGTRVARSDTIMLAQVDPLPPRVSLLSIPRDLWVAIPGQGENRINTAHFYAESLQPGSGPVALRRTIDQNFGVDAPYYVRVQFRGFRDVVDAMGGVDIYLDEATAGYPPGQHHLTGRKALAFVRSRADSDDFQRMGQGQMMLRAMFQTMLNPLKWLRLPAIIRAGLNAIDTNLPAWHFPRIAMALLRLGPAGIDSHIVDRNMTTPFTTSEGAQVLLPDWGQIGDLTRRLFK